MCAQERDGAPTQADLDLQLAFAVKEERYQDAARIRDQIKALGGKRTPEPAGGGSSRPGPAASGERKESPDEIRERLRQREISRFRDIDTGGDNMATPF
jgi:hypothetical protein